MTRKRNQLVVGPPICVFGLFLSSVTTSTGQWRHIVHEGGLRAKQTDAWGEAHPVLYK